MHIQRSFLICRYCRWPHPRSKYPMAVGIAPDFPSRRKRTMRKGAWPPDPAPFSFAAAHHHPKKCPGRSEISQGPSPRPQQSGAWYSGCIRSLSLMDITADNRH
jgi:hypothetical protein